ncbi:MAG: hypothetical protein KDC34_18580 [Saprospiraceae bacterium]|nr:hypothetical protein [Saprospiraceae bacterium]
MNIPLVILAAGAGRRFGGNKQLAALGLSGEFLMEFNMYEAWKSGVGEAWLIIKPGSQSDWQDLQQRWKAKMIVRLFEQPDELLPETYPQTRETPWGTGHALLAIEQEVASDFLLINADDYYGPNAFQRLLEIPSGTMGLAAFPLAETLSDSGAVNRAVCLRRSEYLAGIEEYTQIQLEQGLIKGYSELGEHQVLEAEMPVSMNCWRLDKRIFSQLRIAVEVMITFADQANSELFLPALIQSGIIEEEWPIELVEARGPWYGLTFASDFQRVRAAMQQYQTQGQYPNPLWKKN